MGRYPLVEPFDQDMLEVGDGNTIYWEQCGNPAGRPAVVLHGGPGSGADPGWRQCFDPSAYRIVLFDQRGCGRSTPHAGEPTVDLSTNTTHHLIADIERLRTHLGIDRWLVLDGSWGATLGLAYAQRHPARVSAMVLFSVTNTTRTEVDWLTVHMRRFFPVQWARFAAGAGTESDLAAAYSRLLHDPGPAVRDRAARDWCTWEDTHVAIDGDPVPDPRFEDPAFRLCFARLVTHYWSHAAWLEDGVLLREAGRLAGIPGVLVHGRLDLSSPPDVPILLAEAWPDAELILIDDAGHGAGHPGVSDAVIAATDRFRHIGGVA
jgi:proline iminopeptidase